MATQAGKGMEFLNHVVRMLWDGSTDNWHEGDHLSRAINLAGLNGKTLLDRAETNVGRIDAAISNNEAAQEKTGHSGTPLMVFKGEPFFSQDRIKLLIWRLKESGLRARNSSG